MSLSSGDPQPIISNVALGPSALGQHWKLLASAHHLILCWAREEITLDWPTTRWALSAGTPIVIVSLNVNRTEKVT